MEKRLAAVLAAIGVACTAAPAAAAADETKPFGLTCTEQNGVRFCKGSVAQRPRTFDGTPIDVNVTLPLETSSDLPLLITSHGWGGQKAANPNASYAKGGYAVLAISMRGWGDSCGAPESRQADPAACATGWTRLDDLRYEVRDAQHLAGLLADQGIVDPQKVVVSGGSYGGGLAMGAAALRDRIMLPDGTLQPWTSPQGKPMRIAAASAGVPWSDLLYALMPNGRDLDYTVTNPGASLNPPGVMKLSLDAGLFAVGARAAYYGPELNGFMAFFATGDQPSSPAYDLVGGELARYHGSYDVLVRGDQPPAPLMITNGFTDDLFPVDEGVRVMNLVQSRWPEADIAMLSFDTGHGRALKKPADEQHQPRAVRAWIDRHVLGDEDAEPLSGVTAYTQTCPVTAPSEGPFHADTWMGLRRGEVRRSFVPLQAVTSAGGDLETSQALDPGLGGNACTTVPDAVETGTAAYRVPVTERFTMVGSPTVEADLVVAGASGQVVTRLFDVDPAKGTKTLVARGVYRPDPLGRQVFQLHPNAYSFEPGHEVELQVLGRDVPYVRPSNSPFTIAVQNLELRLPTYTEPGGGMVAAPSPLPLPAGAEPAPGL